MYTCAHFDLKKIIIFVKTQELIISPRNCENDITSSKPFNRYGSKLLIILYNNKN